MRRHPADKLAIAEIRESLLADEIAKLRQVVKFATALWDDLEDLADVTDGSDGKPRPNMAASLTTAHDDLGRLLREVAP